MVPSVHDDSGYELRLVNDWDVHEIADLYREGKWWDESWDSRHINRLIEGSFLFAVAVDRATGRAIGMGRVISDGVSDGYIQDLVVRSEARHRGIGRAILHFLVEKCRIAHLGWVGCIAEPGTDEFYLAAGFEPMDGYVPLILKKESPC
jgi:GNAT superfamily N-acetyltransferase